METDSWNLSASEQKDKVCGKEEADVVTGEIPTEESPRSRKIEGFRLKGAPSSGKETQQDKQQSHITKFWILRLEKTSYRLPGIKRNKKRTRLGCLPLCSHYPLTVNPRTPRVSVEKNGVPGALLPKNPWTPWGGKET